MYKNEIKLDKDNPFTTKYGTTLQSNTPSVIYLRTKAKITPSTKQKSYNEEITSIKNDFEGYVRKVIHESKSVDNDYIFSIDISEKGVKWGKPSFLRYDVYLRPVKQRSLELNLFRMRQLSIKLDKKLEELLNASQIKCM